MSVLPVKMEPQTPPPIEEEKKESLKIDPLGIRKLDIHRIQSLRFHKRPKDAPLIPVVELIETIISYENIRRLFANIPHDRLH